jgi:hypothetical protein
MWVLNYGAQADARGVTRVDSCARKTYAEATPAVRKVSGERGHSATIADIVKALG